MTNIKWEDVIDITVSLTIGNATVVKRIEESNIKIGLKEDYKNFGHDDMVLHRFLDVYVDEKFSFDLGKIE